MKYVNIFSMLNISTSELNTQYGTVVSKNADYETIMFDVIDELVNNNNIFLDTEDMLTESNLVYSSEQLDHVVDWILDFGSLLDEEYDKRFWFK